MALDIKKDKQAAAAPEAPAQERRYVTIELTKYTRYNRKGQLYENGVPYRFTEDAAQVLLQEDDEVTGEPIWKIHRPKSQIKQRQVEANGDLSPVDMTGEEVEILPEADENAPSKRIDIGDDSELDGILPSGDNGVSV